MEHHLYRQAHNLYARLRNRAQRLHDRDAQPRLDRLVGRAAARVERRRTALPRPTFPPPTAARQTPTPAIPEPLAYAGLYELINDRAFRGRAMVAMFQLATAILADAAGMRTEDRAAWAKKAIQSPLIAIDHALAAMSTSAQLREDGANLADDELLVLLAGYVDFLTALV